MNMNGNYSAEYSHFWKKKEKKLLCFFFQRILINYSSALVQKHYWIEQALGTHAAKKQAEAAAGGNQCAQIFDFDFESVSYLRITFPRKYQIVSGHQIAIQNRPAYQPHNADKVTIRS